MKKFILILSIILFYNCSPKLNSAKETNLTFRNGNEIIKLEILSENKFIKIEIPTKVKVITENIKVENLSFSAPGIRFIKTEPKLENEITLEINAKKESAISGKFTLNVSYKSDGKMVFNKFLIPIK